MTPVLLFLFWKRKSTLTSMYPYLWFPVYLGKELRKWNGPSYSAHVTRPISSSKFLAILCIVRYKVHFRYLGGEAYRIMNISNTISFGLSWLGPLGNVVTHNEGWQFEPFQFNKLKWVWYGQDTWLHFALPNKMLVEVLMNSGAIGSQGWPRIYAP